MTLEIFKEIVESELVTADITTLPTDDNWRDYIES